MTREYLLAIEAFGMSPKQLFNTIIYGFKRSFFPGTYLEKRQWVRSIIDHYERVWAEAAPQA